MHRVSVVIPNWNGSKLLVGCLESLQRQSYRDFAVYVVDNGSGDDSVALMQTRFPDVHILLHERNLGFAAAVNTGIAASNSKYVVALNNDTEVEPDWLAELVAAMDQNQSAGFGASTILDFWNRTLIDTVGDGYSAFGLSFKIGSRQKDQRIHRKPFDVFGASAAASIYRRRMLDEIGHFDPDFFAYMEDVDLSIRARLAGYRCVSVPAAVVYHMGAASTGGSATAFSIRLTVRNMIAVIIKNVPAQLLPRFIASVAVMQVGAIAQCLLTDRYPWLRRNLKAYALGLLDAARTAPGMFRKRRAVQNLRRLSSRDFSRLMSESVAMRRQFETDASAPPQFTPEAA